MTRVCISVRTVRMLTAIRYAQPQSGEAPSGECLRARGRHWCNCR